MAKSVQSESGGSHVSDPVLEEQPPTEGYEEQFTAFIDLLGFSEISTRTDDTTRLKVLELLRSLAGMRGEFNMESRPHAQTGSGTLYQIRPAISTFSDHIVVSFPLQRMASDLGTSEDVLLSRVILSNFGRLLTRIAASALRLGFLIRGGATIGRLYHSQGVVFGEALIEAFQIESRIANFPRVVLSQRLTSRRPWTTHMDVAVGNDGLHHFDYFKLLALSAAMPGPDYANKTKEWFQDVVAIVARELKKLKQDGRLNEFAKWTWFSHEFRRGLESVPSDLLKSYGISLSEFAWPS